MLPLSDREVQAIAKKEASTETGCLAFILTAVFVFILFPFLMWLVERIEAVEKVLGLSSEHDFLELLPIIGKLFQ